MFSVTNGTCYSIHFAVVKCVEKVQFWQKFGFNLGPKSAKKAPFFTQLKAAILISLFGKTPQNNESGVYENFVLFSSKNESGVWKICKRV